MRRKRQCEHVAGGWGVDICCTRRRGHDGQHHNVIWEYAWVEEVVAKRVEYVSDFAAPEPTQGEQ